MSEARRISAFHAKYQIISVAEGPMERKMSHELCEHCRAIDIRHLQRGGRLIPGRSFTLSWVAQDRELRLVSRNRNRCRLFNRYRTGTSRQPE
jgi:hypothetical protein